MYGRKCRKPFDSGWAAMRMSGSWLAGNTITGRTRSAAGTTLQDPVRGVMNAAGLDGSNHGSALPGYPDASWQPVTLPDSWSARGVPPGIGWYRTSFSLNLPRSSYVPVDVQVGGPAPARTAPTTARSSTSTAG
jgi:Beta-galactosidase jelly roll domain